MNKALKVLGKEGPKFLRQLVQNYGKNTEDMARKGADFLGPDGLADVALSPYLSSSAGWAPGMALYPPEIDTSSERPGGSGIQEEDYPEFLQAIKADHRRKQLEKWKPAEFSKGGAAKKVKGGLDSISKMIADAVGAREASKLQSIVGQMDLSPKVNFPAAWAGDQKSLQAAQRNISEKETGLQSPGRRKILKQAAASAARSAIPDVVSGPLLNTVMKGIAEEAMPSVVKLTPKDILSTDFPVAYSELIDAMFQNDYDMHDLWGAISDGEIPIPPLATVEGLAKKYNVKPEDLPPSIREDMLGALMDGTAGVSDVLSTLEDAPNSLFTRLVEKLPSIQSDLPDDELLQNWYDKVYDSLLPNLSHHLNRKEYLNILDSDMVGDAFDGSIDSHIFENLPHWARNPDLQSLRNGLMGDEKVMSKLRVLEDPDQASGLGWDWTPWE